MSTDNGVNVYNFIFWALEVIILCSCYCYCSAQAEEDDNEDILLPFSLYPNNYEETFRVPRDLSLFDYGNITYERIKSDTSIADKVYERKSFVIKTGPLWDEVDVLGRQYTIYNPHLTVSVLEPGYEGGCRAKQRATVLQSISDKKCLLAFNAGFFNTSSGDCYGNVVTNGNVMHRAGEFHNVHFGITDDNFLHIGYVNNSELLNGKFKQLVGGVIWLVRNGSNYVDNSKITECPNVQETGALQYFIEVRSARTVLGFDRDGRVVVVSVDGQTGKRGLNLYDFATFLIKLGIVNAINMDGGGSATVAENDVIVNYPSDACNDTNSTIYRCARKVSTVLCVHHAPCVPQDCNLHGDCVNGQCRCHGNWLGSSCQYLHCGSSNCSGHGICTEDGCQCSAGWHGTDCEDRCAQGLYGLQCLARCHCEHGGTCQPVDGFCYCPPGFIGHHCELECPSGTYGVNCKQHCNCRNSCTCDHITGNCSAPLYLPAIDQCYAQLLNTSAEQYAFSSDRQWTLTMCLLGLSAVSFIINILLLCLCCCKKSKKCDIRQSWQNHYVRTNIPDVSDDDDNETTRMTSSFN